MAEVKDIFAFLDKIAPFRIQEGFDNAGFLAGRGNRNVTKLLVSLDITEEVAEEAERWGAELIVAHHPVIFQPVKSVTDETVTGRILLRLLEGGVAAICAHTNLDAAFGGVNSCLAQALELTDIGPLQQAGEDGQGRPYGIGRTGTVHRPGLNAAQYAAFVKERLGSACGSMLDDALHAGCDTFVTADLKYNQFLDAKAMGLNLLDAGHFPTENVVCRPLAEQLSAAFPGLEVRVSQVHKEVFACV